MAVNKAKQHQSLRSLDSLFVAFFRMASPLLRKTINKNLPLLAALNGKDNHEIISNIASANK